MQTVHNTNLAVGVGRELATARLEGFDALTPTTYIEVKNNFQTRSMYSFTTGDLSTFFSSSTSKFVALFLLRKSFTVVIVESAVHFYAF